MLIKITNCGSRGLCMSGLTSRRITEFATKTTAQYQLDMRGGALHTVPLCMARLGQLTSRLQAGYDRI